MRRWQLRLVVAAWSGLVRDCSLLVLLLHSLTPQPDKTYLKKAIIDVNAPAQEKGMAFVATYLNCNRGDGFGDLATVLIEKGLPARAATRAHSEVALMALFTNPDSQDDVMVGIWRM